MLYLQIFKMALFNGSAKEQDISQPEPPFTVVVSNTVLRAVMLMNPTLEMFKQIYKHCRILLNLFSFTVTSISNELFVYLIVHAVSDVYNFQFAVFGPTTCNRFANERFTKITVDSSSTHQFSHPTRRHRRRRLHPRLHFHLKERTNVNVKLFWPLWFNFVWGLINVLIFTRGMDDFTPLLHDHHESTNDALA